MSNILLIEPDKVLAQTYRAALARVGHVVQLCPTAQKAIMAADEQCPDVVVLELQLTAHSGVEFLYEFRSYTDWQHVPVVVHTNVPPSQLDQNFITIKKQLGIVEYLYKPATNLRTLLRSVEEAAAAKV